MSEPNGIRTEADAVQYALTLVRAERSKYTVSGQPFPMDCRTRQFCHQRAAEAERLLEQLLRSLAEALP